MVGAAVVDEEGELLRFLLFARRLEPAPRRVHEPRLAVLGGEDAVGVETLRSDELAVLEGGRRLLDAVGAHGAKPFVGDELAALGVAVIAVHEGVFLGLPVEALELVGDVGLAHFAEHAFEVVGEARRDEAVGHRLAGRVHVALGQAQPALAVHRGEVHLAGRRRRQPDVAGLADLGRHDVDVDREQPALALIAPRMASTMAFWSP